jgi:hypothetical protein
VVSTNGLEEGRFQVWVFVEEIQRRQQQVVEKEISVITTNRGVVLEGRRKPALRLFGVPA